MAISGVHVRLVRAAFRFSVRHLAQRVGVNKGTVVNLEAGGGAQTRTAEKLLAAFGDMVEFVEETDEHGPGIILKKGWEKHVQEGADIDTESGKANSGLNSATWDWEGDAIELDDTPLESFKYSDEDRAEMLAYWRAKPERWASLAEVSRHCLLRAMGVERL
jgi:DNA-binding XRE family transcriptional regulator